MTVLCLTPANGKQVVLLVREHDSGGSAHYQTCDVEKDKFGVFYRDAIPYSTSLLRPQAVYTQVSLWLS
jgi:hypothetical protein